MDQKFGEKKGNRNGKVRQSNRSGLLDPLPFPFPFSYPSPNPRSKHSLKVYYLVANSFETHKMIGLSKDELQEHNDAALEIVVLKLQLSFL